MTGQVSQVAHDHDWLVHAHRFGGRGQLEIQLGKACVSVHHPTIGLFAAGAASNFAPLHDRFRQAMLVP